MKRRILALACVCMLLAAMTAVPAMAENLKGEITFAFWDVNQQEGMQALVDAYVAQHPGVSIS